ncbi:MAG: PepSY-associated TM helix domain-containing protein [Pirellulales bacterium]|nr:PepSY-associated TM helix domain-containing protein [Pirellulales bacterium]
MRRWLLVLHRDLGYFFTGITVLYAISGLAVNHARDWNPSYITERKDVRLDLPNDQAEISAARVRTCLDPLGEAGNYRSHSFPSSKKIKIYLTEGDILANLEDGTGVLETCRRRPLLHHFNMLHLNPVKWWRAFSDCFAVGLLVIAITGMCIPRGRQGLVGRGKWLVGSGMLIPLAAMMLL